MDQRSIVKCIYNNSLAAPQKNAVIATDRTVTYSELWNAVTCANHFLKAKGIKTGDRVMLEADHTAEYLACCYGIHLAGAVHVPIENKAPDSRFDEIAQEIKPALILKGSHPLEQLGITLEEAVKKFQKDNGLTETGVADSVTIEKIETAITEQSKKESEKVILKTATVADDALSNIVKSTVNKQTAAPSEKKAEKLSAGSEASTSTTNDQLPLIGFAGAFLALSAALIAVVTMKKKRNDDILK